MHTRKSRQTAKDSWDDVVSSEATNTKALGSGSAAKQAVTRYQRQLSMTSDNQRLETESTLLRAALRCIDGESAMQKIAGSVDMWSDHLRSKSTRKLLANVTFLVPHLRFLRS